MKTYTICKRCGRVGISHSGWMEKSFVQLFHILNKESFYETACPDCVTEEEKKEIEIFKEKSFCRCMECRRIRSGSGWVADDELIADEIRGRTETTGICDSCLETRDIARRAARETLMEIESLQSYRKMRRTVGPINDGK